MKGECNWKIHDVHYLGSIEFSFKELFPIYLPSRLLSSRSYQSVDNGEIRSIVHFVSQNRVLPEKFPE